MTAAGALLTTLSVSGSTLELRRATADDLAGLVALLAQDVLGATREALNQTGEELAAYRRAFDRIDADPAHLLVVARAGREVAGTLQLSVLPGLSRRGALRGQIETVHVRSELRGRGLGAAMIGWAIEEARRRGCGLVQLTSDKVRADAHRFYGRLGFIASHEGFKLQL
ncbi:MAG: family N-acetyltransferase [Blastococcus sp.]|nr:family N-acetyltransferase [Blastococcus sp.]